MSPHVKLLLAVSEILVRLHPELEQAIDEVKEAEGVAHEHVVEAEASPRDDD